MQTRLKSGIVKPKQILSLTVTEIDSDPTCYSQVVKHDKWKVAMTNEYNALVSNNTWELVLYRDQNIMVSKWIYKAKYKSDRVECHNARLLAHSIHQHVGIDFFDTFCPVVKPTSVYLILTLVMSLG